MLPDDHPEIDPLLADAINDVVVRTVDEETARQHLAAIVAQAGKISAPQAPSLPRRDRRHTWRAGLGAAVATVLMPVGLSFAGVTLPEVVEQPYRAVGIPLPADRTGPPAPAVPAVAPPAVRDDGAEGEVVAPVSPNEVAPVSPRGSDRRVEGTRAARPDRRSGASARGRESRGARNGGADSANGRTGQERNRRRVTPQHRSDASVPPGRNRQPAAGSQQRPAKPQPVPRGTSGRTSVPSLPDRHPQDQERGSPSGRAPKAAASPDHQRARATAVAGADHAATAGSTDARRSSRTSRKPAG